MQTKQLKEIYLEFMLFQLKPVDALWSDGGILWQP